MTDDDLHKRRETLRAQLQSKEEAAEREQNPSPSTAAGFAAAFRLSTEFISAIAVGVAFGFGLDWLLGTTPWLLILFLLLGFAAGVLNVLRSAGLIQTPQVGKRPAGRGDDSRPSS
ncbi:MAG: AtpZ/AtpI family protein [Pseudomonadota bacterium]